jgi:hypothetical protein
MNDIKFCKDCKHLDKKYQNADYMNFVYCMRPDGLNLVTGENKPRAIVAVTERNLNATGCGEKAKYFEPIRDTSNIESEF